MQPAWKTDQKTEDETGARPWRSSNGRCQDGRPLQHPGQVSSTQHRLVNIVRSAVAGAMTSERAPWIRPSKSVLLGAGGEGCVTPSRQLADPRQGPSVGIWDLGCGMWDVADGYGDYS